MSDPEKPKPSLLPTDALYAVMRVLEAGNQKDGRQPHDWEDLGAPGIELMRDAAMRHLLEDQAGRPRDPETGELHLAHAAASALLALALAQQRGVD